MAETHADIRELSTDELNDVSGGDAVAVTTLGGIAGRHGIAITSIKCLRRSEASVPVIA